MVYVKRDGEGQIAAMFAKQVEPELESIDLNDAEVLDFLANCDDSRWELIQSDIQLIRVIEDLVEILMEKNVITITDFPAAAIEKLVSRRGVREQLINASGLVKDEDDDDEDISF